RSMIMTDLPVTPAETRSRSCASGELAPWAPALQLAIGSTDAALLHRAQLQGTAGQGTRNCDLLKLASAIAWASGQAPEDADLLDRLLTLVTCS
ncbi:MAG TPA: hypothetical protein VFX25_00350, partial [Streptosporangiaceae bacterium]|nr:hypothetical protein [Streptosporangiaceae bacterium]